MCFQQSKRQRNTCLQPEPWPLKASSLPAWLGHRDLLPQLARDLGRPWERQPAGLQTPEPPAPSTRPTQRKRESKEPLWDALAGQQGGKKSLMLNWPLRNCFGSNALCYLDKVQSHQDTGVYAYLPRGALPLTLPPSPTCLVLEFWQLGAVNLIYHSRRHPLNFPSKTFLRSRFKLTHALESVTSLE